VLTCPSESRPVFVPPLTRREREVIDQVAVGLTNAEVAAVLSMSVETVKCHLRSVFAKLGVRNRRAAVCSMFGVPGIDYEIEVLPAHAPISQRERVVLSYVAVGMTNREIARALHVSIDTVRSHVKNACKKLGTHTRREAVRIVASCETGRVTTAA
jgi:DNA-binding CsgD family transcriptional regulator